MNKPMKTLAAALVGGALSVCTLSANAWWGSDYYNGPWGGGPWYGYGYPGYGYGYPGYGYGYPGYGYGYPGYGYGYPGYGWGGYPYSHGWGGYPYHYGYGYPAAVAPVQPATVPETRTAK